MENHTNPQPEPVRPGRQRWQIAAFQLLFGTLAVGLGGFISAEPTLSLDRRDDGRLECRYALNAYGRLPGITASIDDLVRYDVTVGQRSGIRGARSSSQAAPTTSYTLHLIGRNGSEIAVGQTWDLAELDRMIEGNRGGPSYHERIIAGPARRYGGFALGAFGLLLLTGAIWNIVLMATGLGGSSANREPQDRQP